VITQPLQKQVRFLGIGRQQLDRLQAAELRF
jgi:hypothetical protein